MKELDNQIKKFFHKVSDKELENTKEKLRESYKWHKNICFYCRTRKVVGINIQRRENYFEEIITKFPRFKESERPQDLLLKVPRYIIL